MVCVMRGPTSYTGEDVVEVQAHGGPLNLERLLEVFVKLGARLAEPGEFTRRAFLNGRMDLSQAEAVAEIVAARSERALKNAQVLLGGRLGDEVRGIRSGVVEVAAQLEAEIDFFDDVQEGVRSGELEGRLGTLGGQIERLAGSYAMGRRLAGVSVGLVGPVNAGKSSLFNGLLGGRRAVVSSEPGTTRDYLEAEVFWEGHRLTLLDSAGWRTEGDGTALEQAGHEIAGPVLRECELRVAVIDVAAPVPWERQLGEDGASLVAANKVDLVRPEALENIKAKLPAPVVLTSAISGEGLDVLRAEILRLLFPEAGQSEAAQVTKRRQWEALVRARDALGEARSALGAGLAAELVVEHVRHALGALGEITGETYTDAVLDQVFVSFCIGK
jgi:tRNA modification GTPase